MFSDSCNAEVSVTTSHSAGYLPKGGSCPRACIDFTHTPEAQRGAINTAQLNDNPLSSPLGEGRRVAPLQVAQNTPAASFPPSRTALVLASVAARRASRQCTQQWLSGSASQRSYRRFITTRDAARSLRIRGSLAELLWKPEKVPAQSLQYFNFMVQRFIA